MARPSITGLSVEEQQALYDQLRHYNEGRDSYRMSGAYLIVLPYGEKKCFSLWFYSPFLEKGQILYIDDLFESIHQSLRRVTSLFFHSSRKLFIVEYNEKHMTTKGDDLVGFGKYRGHYLYEVARIDPNYISWIASKYTPKIPKQERFVLVARAYLTVHLDMLKRKELLKQETASQYLGKKGDSVKDIHMKITHIRLEDDPYKTCSVGSTTYFYVSQVLYLIDKGNNRAIVRLSALYPSLVSGRLSALEHAYQIGEVVHIASARISQTFEFKGTKYTRLNYVKLHS